ncbi:hypothetical protein [Stutzerimonas stutzeri]|uniref:Phage infection protein n=1 Tax=Stutzerimonas stutzeri TaxID=316 RepID=A0A6I6LG20_STUST|nr:hypothetical protein [Stutzerimonas stutzeri]QGZ29464.1 hypothetical protein GQA94_05025 [Stutzerimonas stutzeri]
MKKLIATLLLTGLTGSAFAVPPSQPQPLLGEAQGSDTVREHILTDHGLAENGSERTPLGERLAEDGFDLTPLGEQLAEDGFDLTPQADRLADDGFDRTPLGQRLAENGSDRTQLGRI